MLINMLAKTGDKRIICIQQKDKLQKKINKIVVNFGIEDIQLEDFTRLLKQFDNFVDIWLKNNNVSLEDNQ